MTYKELGRAQAQGAELGLGLDEIAGIVGGVVVGDRGVTVTAPAVLDSRQAAAGGLFVAFAGERVDGHDYAEQAGRGGAVAVLGSRATALPTVVVEDVRGALQRLAAEVVARVREGLSVVGVTGSQGKTGTKDFLAAVLGSVAPTVATEGSLNNELGVPITMLRVDARTRFLVLEMGARHVGDIAALTGLVAPDVGVVLNVGVAHLGEFGSRGAIAEGKGELVRGLAVGGTAVLNADDPRVVGMRALVGGRGGGGGDGRVLTFGRSEDADVRVMYLALDRLGRPSFTVRAGGRSAVVTLPVVGAHQAVNAAAAVAAGMAVGVPLEVAAGALGGAEVSKWRMELRELGCGALLVNDSYNANPDSVRAALDALAAMEGGVGGVGGVSGVSRSGGSRGRRIAVLGEMLELGATSEVEHRAVGRYAAGRADVVVAVGEAARSIGEGAGERAVMVAGKGEAVDWLRGFLRDGDVVLVKASRGACLDEVAAALD